MSETSEDVKPFKYTRTFQSNANERPLTDMDKEALENYINGILGVKDPKSNQTKLIPAIADK